ncbi:MAG: sigma-54-dependent Fis family transcriptional regulator, partial [Candidatus Saccharibacteria bacterium]|nr:sigma-54-dependent Fis family transcriptional regulator [Pseudorhodobacter sp.]
HEIQGGRFRQELYDRLNVVPIPVPSLEERREDVPELTRHFVAMFHRTQGLPNRDLTPEAEAMLQTMQWPGNIRQLRNVIERVLILGDTSGQIEAHELPGQDSPVDATGRMILGGAMATLPLREAGEVFEREYLLTQINRFGGNISRTAGFVGMERSALHRKLKSLGVVSSGKNNGIGSEDDMD